jgi:alpha-L-rhamnosidase
MSLMANAYTFNDPELVRRSLVALGRAGIQEKDINGIIDYSLWWIISQDHYQLYFGDARHLQNEWGRIKETMDVLFSRCDSSGFINSQNTWLFIDWTHQEKWSALQVLWWWAQESGARLAHRMNDTELETRLKKSAANLQANLMEQVWNGEGQYWQSKIGESSIKTRYPNFLAVISGLTGENQYDGMRKLLEDPAVPTVGTPYMYGFEMIALARLGDVQTLIGLVKSYWGGMLGQGATSFWEAYDPKQSGNQHYEFYNRPYGKSLCHAWSAGPAVLLPAEIAGLRPLEDGWESFTVDPNPGQLQWVSTTVPTKFGNITVDIENRNISIRFPKGTTLIRKGRSITGPDTVNEQME